MKYFIVKHFLIVISLLAISVWALDLRYTGHPDEASNDLEFENLVDNAQPKTTVADRRPALTDKAELGSKWYDTVTNRIYIREKIGWQQFNFSGWEMVDASTTSGNGIIGIRVNCTTGKSVLGGGCEWTNNSADTGSFLPQEGVPFQHGFECRAQNTTGADRTTTTRAVCAYAN